jgi:superfamily II DNA or RNA helicase/HKD family nuclease
MINPPVGHNINARLVLNDSRTGARVLTRLHHHLRTSTNFWFFVAFANQEGVASLIQSLTDLRDRGVKGRILLSEYLNFTEPLALKSLIRFDNLEVRISRQGSVHSKAYCFLRGESKTVIIGSSNWTAAALSTNTELNVELDLDECSVLWNEISSEFNWQFCRGQIVTLDYIQWYEKIYNSKPNYPTINIESADELFPKYSANRDVVQDGKVIFAGNPKNSEIESLVFPNRMQIDALCALTKIRGEGKQKALIISATGTGKTLLSAFDAKQFGTKTLLFVVHRENIARASLMSYKKVFGGNRKFGLYTGNYSDVDAEFVFSTVQTLSRADNLIKFSPNKFDYIVVDESHRAGARSYERFLNYFKPKFLLGITATPERTDGQDIFRFFDYNIAYEIRLQRALLEGMLCPFHYFGIVDVSVDDKFVDDEVPFNRLVADERINQIINKSLHYGCYDGIIRGLIFCSRVDEARSITNAMVDRGFRVEALSGDDSEAHREHCIKRLEAHVDSMDRLDYIITVDIFNEGVDIPLVNQIIMLRPTQSAIIFVQQLGRGLRKVDGRSKYLTVIDFIGVYQNNYLIPIALYGDRTYDKDRVRRLMYTGCEGLSGTSTVNFEPVAKERVFASINNANTSSLKDLRADYFALKARLGKIPMMSDFIAHDSRDPISFSKIAKSYYSFVAKSDSEFHPKLELVAQRVLEAYSRDSLSGCTIEEALILEKLFDGSFVTITELANGSLKYIDLMPNLRRWESAFRSVNLRFIRENVGGSLKPLCDAIGVDLLDFDGTVIRRKSAFDRLLGCEQYRFFLSDLVSYSKTVFLRDYDKRLYVDGFQRYKKYKRSDVFRVLGASENPVAQNVGGYLIANNKSWCPLFVTYKKADHIADSTKYEDRFLSPNVMRWYSKSNRTLKSPDVVFFRDESESSRILLFVQKNNDEGIEFYYISDVTINRSMVIQKNMADGKPVVQIDLDLTHSVDDAIFQYIVD